MTLSWRWGRADPTYQNYGNANQWTVSAGMQALARESAQNSNDARSDDQATLMYDFIRLTGKRRREFEDAIKYGTELLPHLHAMGSVAGAAVTAKQIKAGVEAVGNSDSLILLRVSDYGCSGLTGPELPIGDPGGWGNLVKLCRLDLFSGKDEASGGSFGLGKAVYWRFSRLQTVLFNSTIDAENAVEGNHENRVLGVSQGVPHEVDGSRFVGRGFFGLQRTHEDHDYSGSAWNPDGLEAMQLAREDMRAGTTALMLGFYDPDNPGSESSGDDLLAHAQGLRTGIEENFWPLITRGRLDVRIRIIEDGLTTHNVSVTADDCPFLELVTALRRYDDGDEMDTELGAAFTTIVRDIPVTIPARVDEKAHPEFVHHAKLVVTMSDNEADTLENRVCLFRKPEMVVETIDEQFDGKKYHAFLLAGVAVDPGGEVPENQWADNFLKLAEPPAHDQWVPRSGRAQASQANLTTDTYMPPWGPNLREIGSEVRKALKDLFDIAPEPDARGPRSILRRLQFLTSEPGTGGGGHSGLPRKPIVDLTEWAVVNGQWFVTFQITARNQTGGWIVRPDLMLLGLDGKGSSVEWDSMEAVAGCSVSHGLVQMAGKERGRRLVAIVRGSSTADLPIPAEESVVDIIVGNSQHGTTPSSDSANGDLP